MIELLKIAYGDAHTNFFYGFVASEKIKHELKMTLVQGALQRWQMATNGGKSTNFRADWQKGNW